MQINKWQKVDDFFFLYPYRKNQFLIRTYPFKIYKLPKHINSEILHSFITKQKKETTEVIPPGRYYLPLIIGTTACNFQCRYCFADKGSYGEKPMMINKNILKSTVKFLEKKMLSLAKNSPKKEIEIGLVFFGGEPLLHLTGLKYLTDCMRKTVNTVNTGSQVQFKPLIIINTNGSLFTPSIMDYLIQNKDIFEVVISFDGLHHDVNRISRGGEPTSTTVISGIKKLAGTGVHYSITSCIPPEYIKDIDKNVTYMAKLFGKKIEINLAFIRGAIKSVQTKALYPGKLQSKYSVSGLKSYGRKVAHLIRQGYHVYEKKFLNRVNEGGYLWRCPASLFEFCVYVDGNVYPCHNFIDNKFALGNIADHHFDPLKKKQIVRQFYNRTVDKLICKDCVFQTVCLSSFDCPSHSYYDLGDFYTVDRRTCMAAQSIMEALLEEKLLKVVAN